MIFKKYFSLVFLVPFLILLLIAFTFTPSITPKAQAEDISIAQLVELFISLNIIPADKAAHAREALAQFSASSASVCESVTLSKNLDVGAKGADVTKLQTYLAKDSTLYPEGIISGYFGPATQKAVQRFQKKYKIISSGSAYGYVGPKTRAALAECHTVGVSVTNATSRTTTAKPTVTFLYPTPGSVYSTNERLTVVTRVTNISSPSTRVRFYLSGGVYKNTWYELDQTYTTGGYASLTIPQAVVTVWGAGVPFKLKAELEEWEVGAFVKKAETTMLSAFMLSGSVLHGVYYSTGADTPAQLVYLKLKEQAREFGTTYPYVGVDSFDINDDGQNDVLGYINSIDGPLCGSKGCRFSLYVSSSSNSGNTRTPVYFDTALYRTAHGNVMILATKTNGYNDIAFLATSGKYDLYRWDGDSYVFGRTVDVLPNLESANTNTTNNTSNTTTTTTTTTPLPPPPPPPPGM